MAQTPSTEDIYEGDGVQTVFPLTFPYLKSDEVFVSVDDVDTPYVWVGGSTASVQLAVAPILGAIVRVYRSTRAFVPLHVFAGGVPFLPRYIDENNRQLLYVSQEAINSTAGTAAEALVVAEEAKEIAQDAEDKIDAAIIDSSAQLRADLAAGTGSLVGLGGGKTAADFITGQGAGLIGWLRNATGAVVTTLGDWFNRRAGIDVFDFMTPAQVADVQGPAVLDHSAPVIAALQHAFTKVPAVVKFGKGTFNVTNLPNVAYKGLTLRGADMLGTVLKFSNSGSALRMDAFASGSPTDPFIHHGCNLQDLTLEGNANTSRIIDAQGIAQYNWRNVNTREANPTTGIAVDLKGCVLGNITGLYCSVNLNPMVNKPSEGLRITSGTRGGSSVGRSTNNTIRNCYMEGLPIGWRLLASDQNIFIGGAPEASTTYGMIVAPASRFNTFLGVGYENSLATAADVDDAGESNRHINCYSAKEFRISGRDIVVRGGFFEKINVLAAAVKASIGGVTMNYWATGSGGFVDAGSQTHYGSIYDWDASAYVYPKKARASVATGPTPWTWTNTTGQYVTAIWQGATVTQVRVGNGTGDLWLVQAGSPGSTFLKPGDVVELSFSGTPSFSYIVHNHLS